MKTKRKAKIEFKKTKAGGQKGAWRFTVVAANGEPLGTSEGYTSKQDAERGSFSLLIATLDIGFEVLVKALKKAKQ